MKKISVTIIICVLFACRQAPNTKKEIAIVPKDRNQIIASDSLKMHQTSTPISADQLITAGKSIGHIAIGTTQDMAMKQLGKPDFEDAAMGSVLQTWYTNHDSTNYQTSIFLSHNYGGKDESNAYIKKILVSSPWFKTQDKIGVGSNKDEIEKQYVLKPIQSFLLHQKIIQVFSDVNKGISFEIDSASNKCVGIIIHAIGKAASTYIDMHER